MALRTIQSLPVGSMLVRHVKDINGFLVCDGSKVMASVYPALALEMGTETAIESGTYVPLENLSATALSSVYGYTPNRSLLINGYWSDNAEINSWLQLQIVNLAPQRVIAYSFKAGYQGMRNWIFQGSNDGNLWIPLDDQSTRTTNINQGSAVTREFNNNNTYQYYRFANVGFNGGAAGLGSLKMYTSAITAQAIILPDSRELGMYTNEYKYYIKY